MFLSFVNFYKKFIRNFSKIVALLTFILQITGELTEDKTQIY